MSEEKVMDNVNLEGLNTEEIVDVFESYDGRGISKIIGVGVIGTAITLGGVFVAKKKDRIVEWKEERAIRKLEKKGYKVIVPDEDEEVISEDENEVEED